MVKRQRDDIYFFFFKEMIVEMWLFPLFCNQLKEIQQEAITGNVVIDKLRQCRQINKDTTGCGNI